MYLLFEEEDDEGSLLLGEMTIDDGGILSFSARVSLNFVSLKADEDVVVEVMTTEFGGRVGVVVVLVVCGGANVVGG